MLDQTAVQLSPTTVTGQPNSDTLKKVHEKEDSGMKRSEMMFLIDPPYLSTPRVEQKD